MTFSFRLYDDGSIADYKITPTELKNISTLTYDFADKVLSKRATKQQQSYYQSISPLASIVNTRQQWRAKQGLSSMEQPEISM